MRLARARHLSQWCCCSASKAVGRAPGVGHWHQHVCRQRYHHVGGIVATWLSLWHKWSCPSQGCSRMVGRHWAGWRHECSRKMVLSLPSCGGISVIVVIAVLHGAVCAQGGTGQGGELTVSPKSKISFNLQTLEWAYK